MKFLFITLCLSLTISDLSASTIECSYDYYDFLVLGNTYHCEVNEDPQIIDQKSADVTAIFGSHMRSKSGADVELFYAFEKTIKYFPQSLEVFYENLKAIYISDCQLQEIHQSDLKPFEKLTYLSIKDNNIEVIEEGLFDFNPKLETVIFYEKNIIHIDPDVFDNLPNLVNFWLLHVPCIQNDVDNSRTEVEQMIKDIKSKCSNSDYLTLADELKSLESDVNQEKFQDINKKFQKFEDSVSKSKFNSFRPISYKVAALKCKIPEPKEDLLQTSSPEPKEDELQSQDFEDLGKAFEGLINFTGLLSGLVSAQSELESSFKELDNLQNAFSGENRSLFDQQPKNDLLKLTELINELSLSDNTTADTLKDIIADQEALKSSQNSLKSTQDEMKSTQDELSNKVTEMDQYFGSIVDKLEKSDENLLSIEKQLLQDKTETDEKFDRIEKELLESLQNITASFDAKVKEIENNLIKKFEDILEEKLGKILNTKENEVLS